jgi:hypothetical protein
MGETCITHAGRLEIHTKISCESIKGRDSYGDLGADGRIIFK